MDKKAMLRWVLDIMGGLIAIYVVWSVNQINDLVRSDYRQTEQIIAVQQTLETVSKDLARVADTLDRMVFEQEVSNRLQKQKLLDRWSAGCMEDHDLKWSAIIRPIFKQIGDHLDLDLTINTEDLPDIRAIQKKNGY